MTTIERLLPYRILPGRPNTPEWLQSRQCGVGASESAAVLSLSAWGTARTVYDQKIAAEVVDIQSDLMEFGHLAEQVIVAFMLNHPERFGWIGQIFDAPGLMQSFEWPWLLGTLDRMVLTPSGDWVPLELKSLNDFIAAEWRVSDPDDEYAPAEYAVPLKYQVQVQQQMAVTGALYAYVAAWLGKDKLVLIRVERDDAFIQEHLVGNVGDFWNVYVVPRVPPPPTLYDDLSKIFPGDPALPVYVADEDLVDNIGKWRIATTDKRDLDHEIKQLRFDIHNTIGNAEEVIDPLTGKVIHTLKGQNTSRKVDLDVLAVKYPEVYDEVVTPAGRTRVHRATTEKI